jgi:hypothetical protein
MSRVAAIDLGARAPPMGGQAMKRALVLLLLVALILGVMAPIASACDLGDLCGSNGKNHDDGAVDGPYMWDPKHPSGRWLFLKLGLIMHLICRYRGNSFVAD